LLAAAALGCRPAANSGQDLVIAATGEPEVLVPPLIGEAVGRDITDLVFDRLAVLRRGASPVDSLGFEPGLASRWSRVDSTGWRFTLRSGARWHDGQPVTSSDVAFSFAAYVDTALGAPAGGALNGVQVSPDGVDGVIVRFPGVDPEQLFDATYYVRILPRHIWDSVPRARWGADSSLTRLVGSGPYRVAAWTKGQSLILDRVRGDGFRRIVWRFTGDQDAALNLVLSGEADAIETVTGPAARDRASRDSTLTTVPYPSAVAGFLAFRLSDQTGREHPVLGDRMVRQALTHAIDRGPLIRAVIGPDASVPMGPLSRALWIWNEQVRTLGFDTVRAAQLLAQAGWRPGADGVREKAGRRLAVDVLVPATSTARRQLAEGIQQMWRRIGVSATVTAVDFPVFQERLGQGRFDAMVGAWLDEPTPRGLADQWTRAGIGVLNHGRYASPVFDSLYRAASSSPTGALARTRWQEALDTLNADAPAVFLYTPTNLAVVSRRLEGVTIDPFSWLHEIGTWRKRD
jgi:peptide/nickel transport system substrate-binding protein